MLQQCLILLIAFLMILFGKLLYKSYLNIHVDIKYVCLYIYIYFCIIGYVKLDFAHTDLINVHL